MNCNAIAPYYQMLEHLSFGKCLEGRRFAFLQQTTASRRAILCGDGDGRFLARLLQANARVEVDFVELSSEMIGLSERRVTEMGPSFRERVHFYAADVRDFQPQPSGYDLIATHFFLDCFSAEELDAVAKRVASWSVPGAQWLVSEFREAQAPVARFCTRTIICGLYAAFWMTSGLRVTRLPGYEAAIANAGYRLRLEQEALGGLLHSSLWQNAIDSEASGLTP